MTDSSNALLSSNSWPNNSDPLLSPFCIECNTVTSSIAGDSNTLCPTIPNSNFLKNNGMQQDVLTEDRKVLNDGYHVPGPETDFKPFEFKSVPEEQEVHMDQDVFSSTAENF